MIQSPLFRWKSILHFIWKSRSQSLEEEWRGTESMLLEVQCEVSTVSDGLGCHVICWCWSTVFSEVHSQRRHLPGHFRALHASFCWQALWRWLFHFPAWLKAAVRVWKVSSLIWMQKNTPIPCLNKGFSCQEKGDKNCFEQGGQA